MGKLYASQPFSDRCSNIALVSMLLALVAIVASLIPAYRATRIDPIAAIRNEKDEVIRAASRYTTSEARSRAISWSE